MILAVLHDIFLLLYFTLFVYFLTVMCISPCFCVESNNTVSGELEQLIFVLKEHHLFAFTG